MIKDSKKLEQFELSLLKSQQVNVEQNFRILNALYEQARKLGIFPMKNPLDGIEHDIKLAKALKRV